MTIKKKKKKFNIIIPNLKRKIQQNQLTILNLITCS